MIEFKAWGKTPRLYRDIVITEKIDGTNGCIIVVPDENGKPKTVAAQSRTKIITPDDDNHGFAAWVYDNAGILADTLGPGYHYGEWWGHKIQRGYGLDIRVFSLFNTSRWTPEDFAHIDYMDVVPVLAKQTFSDAVVRRALFELDSQGSRAAWGYNRPEGIIVHHTASGKSYKVLLENDEHPKGGIRG